MIRVKIIDEFYEFIRYRWGKEVILKLDTNGTHYDMSSDDYWKTIRFD